MFPDDHSRIGTNLTPVELEEVIEAVEAKRVTWDPKATNMFAESCGGEFEWLGQRFSISEYMEEVHALYRMEPQLPEPAKQLVLPVPAKKKKASFRPHIKPGLKGKP